MSVIAIETRNHNKIQKLLYHAAHCFVAEAAGPAPRNSAVGDAIAKAHQRWLRKSALVGLLDDV